MDKRELEMYSVQDIVTDLLNQIPIKRIARIRKVSKNTVKRYREKVHCILDSHPELVDSIDGIMQKIREMRKMERFSRNFGWLDRNSEIVEKLSGQCSNYVRLLEVLQEKGYEGSYSSLQRYVAKNRDKNEAPVVRIETNPGKTAQVDFGHIRKLYDEDTGEYINAYVFVMVLCYSRESYYEIVKSQDIKTWCNCHIHAFEYFGGVPEVIIPDNLKSAIIKASFLDPVANKSYADLSKHYGFQIDPCLPGTPEHKGKVESGVKYVKNNFLPLRKLRNFTDANRELREWNEDKASVRVHGTTRRQPKELFEQYEQQSLQPLPRDRFEIPVWKKLKVYRDIHIQFDKAYYSVPCELRGEYVFARKTDSQITVFHENKLVAVHYPVLPGKRSTKDDHYPADKTRYMKWDTDYCLKRSKMIGENTYLVTKKLLLDEPIRNLRQAQNIIRMTKKYGNGKLEEACKCAVFYGNYTYGGIKNILEKEIDINLYLPFETYSKKLDSSYARDIDQLLNQGASHGINGTN
jgi:transposase